MKYSILFALILCTLFSCTQEKPRVLVFSKTSGYRHESIGVGKLALMELGKKNNFDVDTTEDASLFHEENLKRYRAVVFLNTTQDVLDLQQQSDFKRFIQAGGGFVGIHAAADTEYEWAWYGRLVGAYFKSHPHQQEAVVKKLKPFGTNALPDTWKRKDEWYNYKNISDEINVIYALDESSYEGGQNGEHHPIAWYHEFDGGRSFYTGMGHTDESYADSLYLDHVLQGIQYAIGEKSSLDYSKAITVKAPEENRFTKTVLDFNLFEPTEMAILPDNRIVFLERRGNVKLYDPKTNKVEVINTFNVSIQFEDGMIGLAADPNFKENNWLYIFYSHPERHVNILSRFTFVDNKIDMASEKQLLEVAVQRESCCHTAGSLAFGPNGNLYASTGDNSNPWESKGYSPSDERPGRGPWDAQKSSSNTNDLRGKVLRIHPEADGTYSIPEGNLFPKGEANTRPEIYVMGCRNPYRISVDQKTGTLYWGEVGPDAGESDSLRGPRGYDEVNMAKKPGNYGWPYFVGKNFAYAKYDFATDKVGDRWNPSAVVNHSINNTGKQELPPATPALIYYPYDKSDEFPMVKDGGRNAMAGPVYYSENYKGSATAFPDYFDGKLIAYDWMRDWMFLVSIDKQDQVLDMEPFMPNTDFSNIIDMQFGNEGRLYMLEYGEKWYGHNLDARLVRIDYNSGNRPPLVKLSVDKTAGAIPLTVKYSAAGTQEFDKGDKLTYTLEVGGKNYTSDDGNFTVTFDKAGMYTAELTVTDDKGTSGTSHVQLTAGNEPPVVTVEITEGNKTFYFPGTPVKYAVVVNDKEDGSTTDGKILPASTTVTFDYLKGFDMAKVAVGHQMPTAELPGKGMINKSDCKSCHIIDEKSAGPSFKEVAAKYKSQTDAIDYLTAKIIKGGGGVWGGGTEMAAHPQISIEDAKKMVEYILSLGEEKVEKKLPLQGSVVPTTDDGGAYILTATYFDKGANNQPPISSTSSVALRSTMLKADQVNEFNTVYVVGSGKTLALDNIKHNTHVGFKNLDLTGIKKVLFFPYLGNDKNIGGDIELHLDKPDGKLLATVTAIAQGSSTLTGSIEPVAGHHDIYLVFKNSTAGRKSLFYLGGIRMLNQ